MNFQPRWGSLTKKKEDESDKEKVAKEEESINKANAALKLTNLLDQAKGKFKEKYGKLKLAITVPALIQLVEQLKFQKAADDVFARDTLFEKAGEVPSSMGKKVLF